VTGEWSQRSGLTTFTLVPHRGRVISAKALSSVLVGVVSIPLAFAIGAVGNVVGTTIAGTDLVWDMSIAHGAYIVLGNVLGMLVGFMLGVLIRSSAGAIVAFFVFSFVIPPLLGFLAMTQDWFRDVQPWVDLDFQLAALLRGSFDAEQWSQLAATSALWLLLPLTVGLWTLVRSEVK
jgi:ABC-type transport system involved in multi-copper enzyme maturation permease subunit